MQNYRFAVIGQLIATVGIVDDSQVNGHYDSFLYYSFVIVHNNHKLKYMKNIYAFHAFSNGNAFRSVLRNRRC